MVLDFIGVSDLISLTFPEVPSTVVGSEVLFQVISAVSVSASGTLPGSWGRLTRLQFLNVESNTLTGTLPSVWSTLAELQSISVAADQLSGSLPSSWSALLKLERVDLGNNKFCGCLPSSWSVSGRHLEIILDAALLSGNCATANACSTATTTTTTTTTTPEPTTTTTTSTTAEQCQVVGCVTCSSSSSTICAGCPRSHTMGVANATCNVSGNGTRSSLSTTLMTAVVALSSVVVLF